MAAMPIPSKSGYE